MCPPDLNDIDTKDLLQKIDDDYNAKPFSCNHCNKRFTHKNYMYVHMKTCKSKPSSSTSSRPTINISTSINGNNNTTIQGNNNNLTVNNIFHIYPIDHANTSFISDETLKNLIELGGKRHDNIHNAIIKLVRFIFCNIKHPENYSVYVPNKKYKQALVWDGSRWLYQHIDDATKSVRNKATYFLIDFYDTEQYNFKVFTQQEWNAFINRQKQDDSSLFKNIDKLIQCEILNHTPEVKQFIKGKNIVSDTSMFIDSD